MPEAIITRKVHKRLQRLVAFVLSLVISVMCLPMQALAAPGLEGAQAGAAAFANGSWKLVTGSGLQQAEYSRLYSEFEARRGNLYRQIMEGIDVDGVSYAGMTKPNFSSSSVMEGLGKYLVLCGWADYNKISDDSGVKVYNLFGAQNISTQRGDNAYIQVRTDLDSIINQMNNTAFWGTDEIVWGAEDSVNNHNLCGFGMTYLRNAKSSKDIIQPGTGDFLLAAQQTVLWLERQVISLLAKEVLTAEELEAFEGSDNTQAVADAIVAKANQANTDIGGDIVEGGDGGVTNIVVDNYNFTTTFTNSTTAVYGDSPMSRIAVARGWIEDSAWNGINLINYSEEADANSPYFAISRDFEGHNMVNQSPELQDEVSTAYITWGYDWFKSEDDPMALVNEVREEQGGLTQYLIDGMNVGAIPFNSSRVDEEGNPLPVEIRIVSIPYTGDSTTDAWIKELNNELPKVVSTLIQTYTTNNQPHVHFGLVDLGSNPLTDDSALSDAFTKAIASAGSITGTDYDGNTVTLPNGTDRTDVTFAQLLDWYKKIPELQGYLRSIANIRDFAASLFNNGFEDDSLEDGLKAYTKLDAGDMATSPFVTPRSLVMDLLDHAYESDIFNIGGGTNPGDLNSDPNKEIEAAKSALSMISNANFGEDNIIVVEDGAKPELKLVGYTAIAAGAVYDPFVSHEGNDAFLTVIRDSLSSAGTDEGKLETMERFLQQALSRKKPLYVIDGNRDQWMYASDVEEAPAGKYRFAYLEDLLQGDQNVTRCYTVMKGGMAPSTVDGNTWVYSQGNDNRSENTDGADAGGMTDDGVTYQDTSLKTPAGSQVQATSNQMSAPVMFTSGTTEGVFVGNAVGSASGFAASVGGLTTVLLHNAAQDAKNNEALQNASSYMLFMNGLGDVVLADGTIILPAIANPAIYTYSEVQYSVDGSTSLFDIVVGAIAGGALTALLVVSIPLTSGASIPVILGCAGAGAAGGAVIGNAAHVSQRVEDMFYSETDSAEVIASYDTICAYYPYTAAFMNHYPSTYINAEGRLTVLNSSDKGKYVIGIDDRGDMLARKITGFNKKTQVNLQYSGGGVTVGMTQGLSFNVESDSKRIGTMLPYYGGEDSTFGAKLNTAVDFRFYMCKNTAYNSDDAAFFPLQDDTNILSESYLNRAGPVCTSARRFLSARNPSGESTEGHPVFDADRYILNMAGQCLMGTMYSETLQKNYQISYDELVEDTGNRILVFFTKIVESAVETLGKIDGVLAIKNGYENKFFNLIVSFIQEFYLLLVVALLIIVAVKFLRGHYNMLFVVFIAVMCFCGFEVYANWMPTVVPAAYNFAVNDAVEQIVWNTISVSAESYAETYQDSSRKDTTTGAPKPYTATMTLYKMTRQDMEDMASRLSTTYTALKSGEIHYLDESAGIFVQGDSIKISIDKLLVNNSMRGLYQSQWQELAADFAASDDFITPVTKDSDMVANPYTIQLTNPYVSLEAYYMPFNEIERAFLINLNKFSSVFRMERHTRSYSKNLYKDCFLFNCYTNSGLFTSPGNKEVLEENVRLGSLVSRYANQEEAMQNFLSRIYGGAGLDPLFPVPEDWLNVAAVFRSPSENFKNSLWGKAMQNKEWYDYDWNITNPEKLNDLIYYINTQTKQFVIANSDQLNFLSDENAIKLVSLYATTAFTHYVSEFGQWLYPNYINAADISLEDVLYGSMTTLKDRNFAYDGNVVNTVAKSLGVFGVIFLLLITILATVFVFVMTYLVPVLYALFGGIIVFKLINNNDSVGLVKGYVKVTGVTCLLYFVFSLSLRLVEVGGYAWYGYLGCVVIMFLCCYFLFWVVLSVVTNLGEMGNDVLGRNLLQGLDNITRGAVRKLTTNLLYSRRGVRGYGGMGRFYPHQTAYQYGRDYGVDSRDFIRGNRAGMFSRYNSELGDYARDVGYDYMTENDTGGFASRLFSRAGRRRGGTHSHIDGRFWHR